MTNSLHSGIELRSMYLTEQIKNPIKPDENQSRFLQVRRITEWLLRRSVAWFLFISLCAAYSSTFADTYCEGAGESPLDLNRPNMDNRFAHCEVGDIVSVFVYLSMEGELSVDEFYTAPPSPNEVVDACDFRHPIAALGDTDIQRTKSRIRWFSCVYRGEKRRRRLAPGNVDLEPQAQ